jgi:hypothetical protein
MCASSRDDPCEFFLFLVGAPARESAKINDELATESAFFLQFARPHVVHEEHLSLSLTLSSSVLTSFKSLLRFRSQREAEITRAIVELPRIVVIYLPRAAAEHSRMRLDQELRLPGRGGEKAAARPQ